VQGLPFATGVAAGGCDSFTPTYTGPLMLCDESNMSGTATLFDRYCKEQGIIAEFAHLHPWSVATNSLDPSCIEVNREIVYVDLTGSEEEIWTKSLSTECRRKTKQSIAAGVRIRRAETLDDVNQFHRLHKETMDRRQALDRYYHPPEYFQELFTAMPENAFFVLAEYEGQVVSGGFFLQDAETVYWELSAVDMAFARARPVNAYLYDTICWARRQGKKRMLLGGAYQSDDGVYRFKAGFSPLRVKFCTYKRIHDADTYAALTDAWSRQRAGAQPHSDYFPAYRSDAPAASESRQP